MLTKDGGSMAVDAVPDTGTGANVADFGVFTFVFLAFPAAEADLAFVFFDVGFAFDGAFWALPFTFFLFVRVFVSVFDGGGGRTGTAVSPL